MERRDYLKKQIDQLGKALGLILSKFLGLKDQGKVNEGIEVTKEALADELDLNIDELAKIPSGKLVETLKAGRTFENENLDKLADLFLLMADNLDPEKEKKSEELYRMSFEIYEYLENVETVYSLDRKFKMDRIKARLG